MSDRASSVDPILIRGLSRSGGTLMVTILDAHPDIAMSYELYPHLLEGAPTGPPDLHRLAELLDEAGDLKDAARQIDGRDLRTFILRCARGGLDNRDLVRIIQRHQETGLDLTTQRGRYLFVEGCAQVKMERKNGRTWGLKCTPAYDEYLNVWPGARFINMIRDGRDVLASQLNTGSFATTPAKLGRSWSRNHAKFREFSQRPDVNAMEVSYEELAHDPEPVVRRIAKFLQVDYTDEMLRYYDADLTIFSTNHLSMDRISAPIDTKMIGRWREDLDPQQLEEFYSEARETLREYGYL